MPEEPVLALGERLRNLLQRVVDAFDADEADDVAADAALERHEVGLGPLLEPRVPRQVEEPRVERPRDDAVSGVHGRSLRTRKTRGCRRAPMQIARKAARIARPLARPPTPAEQFEQR